MLQTHEAGMNAASPLRLGLSQRQLNMIALGGVIGAGLFVGSGAPTLLHREPDHTVRFRDEFGF